MVAFATLLTGRASGCSGASLRRKRKPSSLSASSSSEDFGCFAENHDETKSSALVNEDGSDEFELPAEPELNWVVSARVSGAAATTKQYTSSRETRRFGRVM